MTNENPTSTVSYSLPSETEASNYGSMAIVTSLFFIWGFLTALNDILIPHLKSIFSLTYFEATLVQTAFFSSYFLFGIPAGKLVEWIGYKGTMVTGLLTMGLGALLFLPAAAVPSFPLFLMALVVLAAGITALQVSANPYVSVLGPARTASSRLNFTQAFNSLGTTVAPPLGGRLILAATGIALTQAQFVAMSAQARSAYQQHTASSINLPYLVIAGALVLFAIFIRFSGLPEITGAAAVSAKKAQAAGSVWKHPHVVLGALAIFVYVGAEVSIGSLLISYFTLPEIGHLSEKQGADLVSFYWGGAMVGRLIGAFVLRRVKTGLAVAFVAAVACALVVTSILSTGQVAVWSILAVGLFNSILFPSIFTLGIAEMGPLTSEASGLIIAAIVGGAIIPPIEGALSDRVGLQHAFIVPAICYLYILYYGLIGSKPKPVAVAVAA